MSDAIETGRDSGHDGRLVMIVLAGFALGLVAGALFQSQALLTLSYDLEPGPVAQMLIPIAEAWHTAMQDLGFATISDAVTEQLEAFRARPVVSDDGS